MQAVPFLLKWFKSKYFIKTPREFKELDEPVDFPFMEVYGFLLTVFLMAMTYALVAPIIIVFAFVVFTLGYFVFKYQLFYVFENECDSGGLWWPILFDLLCFSILIFQICTFGALVLVGADATIANSKIPNYLVIPLPFVTVVFWIYMTYVVRPKTELVDDKFVVNSAQETCKTLSDRIFNPALVQDLLKIWLAPQHQQKLPEIYQPKYKSIADYIAEANPEQAEKIKEMEDLRLSKRKSCAATSSRAIFFSAQHSVDTFYSCDDLDDESESQI